MGADGDMLFEAFLNQHDDEAWAKVLGGLSPSIHPVDRTATRIWLSFFPFALASVLQQASDPEQLAQNLLLVGNYRLKDQVDVSPRFLYGYRYWPEVKFSVIEHASAARVPASLELAEQIRDVARKTAARLKVEESLLLGITAVAFMTLQQAGMPALKSGQDPGHIDRQLRRRSPEQIMRARARDDGQGLFGFLRGDAKVYTVKFDENDRRARFRLVSSQHLTTAAARDQRSHHPCDPRCTKGEGPIPVQCRSASCGTCWVGVLGGAEKLSAVASLERRAMKEFGYIDTVEPKPVIRLACQAQAFGAVSIVIPPWNGVFGKFLFARKKEPVEAREPT